ncbi:MAG: VCBS repeat-containing protein [Planctomycetes bacterium]|nr:VCBS repeat-containing protein [Planctomycetota bacterium]
MIALAMALVTVQQPAAREFGRLATLALDASRRADLVTLAELDGQAPREVVVATHERGQDFARALEIWRVAAAGAPVRAESIALTPDVVAFAHGDVLAGGGEELLLFNAGGVFVWRTGVDARPERILECDFLWQTADPSRVFEWREGLRDLDGDGLVDLVVPEPGGFVIALQRRPRVPEAPWGRVSRVRVPLEPDDETVWTRAKDQGRGVSSSRSNGGFSLGFSAGVDEDGRGGTLVSVEERVPAPYLLDWDADRDLDLIVQTSRHLQVWLLQSAGTFSAAPQHSLALPVIEDTARELDASYSAHALDLDADSRADYVVFAGDKRSDDVRTQALSFSAAAVKEGPPLFGAHGRPSGLLVFGGFISDPVFQDLDGDGFPELSLRAVRPDLIDQIRSATSESIESDFYVYRNHRGTLSKQPDVVRSRAIPLERFSLTAEFLGDLTGDGLSELFVRDEPEKLRILMLRAQGPRDKSTWSLLEKPLWERDVSDKAQVWIGAPAGAEKSSLFILEGTQLHWVRFG